MTPISYLRFAAFKDTPTPTSMECDSKEIQMQVAQGYHYSIALTSSSLPSSHVFYCVDPHSLSTLILPSYSPPSPPSWPHTSCRMNLKQQLLVRRLSSKTWITSCVCLVALIWSNWEESSVEDVLSSPAICSTWEYLTNIGKCGFVEAHSCIGWIKQVRMRNTAAWRIGHTTSVAQNSERFCT